MSLGKIEAEVLETGKFIYQKYFERKLKWQSSKIHPSKLYAWHKGMLCV